MSKLERIRNAMEPEPHASSNRSNRLVAEQVEVALVLQEMLGTSAAAKYLYARLIPLNLAMRVLTRPWQRRWRPTVNCPVAADGRLAG
ncbi:hypothetical protein NX784_17490 [Massilia pinisoli]|uniref:Uncharacterized protein n=1 Tax=Massilia pinisoli TaxID=1772194 RepID=A0ABT1ZTY5_9BURK|nr:hypothetical protein [Massilia pinisoli]MCS0583387.1 hypothetical protein [Massilia pinisoli]